MNRPDNVTAYDELDLKLGIKSSLPNVKSTLGLVVLLWEATGRPADLAYSKQNGNELVIAPEIDGQLIDFAKSDLDKHDISEELFLETVNNNQLFKSQMEALIVALELVWKLSKVTFIDTTKPYSAERTGGIRYEKRLAFSLNLDLIHAIISDDIDNYKEVLLSWIGLDVQAKADKNTNLLQVLNALSEGALYKLTDGDKDIVFNQNSLYKKLLLSDEAVDINGDKEAKGSLRILKSALGDGMNPYLRYSGGVVTKLADDSDLEGYQKRVDTFLRLSATKVIGLEDATADNEEVAEDETVAERVKGGTNIILYGVPGAGKSWTIKHEYCDDESRMERLVFHPDYTYSDFVGQILPKVSDDGSVSYEFSAGPFTKLVRKAYINPDKMFYLVIEEVNRGNAPAIFGDVFQLLDRDNDGNSEYDITNADIAKIVYLDDSHKVSIPSNMCILCTMNTSDQNVFTLDTAFQRRWSMRLIRNRFHDEEDEMRFAGTKILDTDVTWERFFTEINNFILGKNIRMTSSEDKRLGTHFVSEDDLSVGDGSERQISRFPEKVLKYLWDDAFKFTKEDVFDLEKVKSLEDVIDLFVSSQGNSRFLVFKENIYNSLVPKDNS